MVKDLTAGMEFFNRTMGVARFYVIEDFGLHARDKIFRGRPAEQNFKLALAYSGDTQIELIQHLSGDTCYKEHLERRGEGLHHLGFFLYDPQEYQRALDSLGAAGYSRSDERAVRHHALHLLRHRSGDRLDYGDRRTSIPAARTSWPRSKAAIFSAL